MSTSKIFNVKKGFVAILIVGIVLAVLVLGASIYLKQTQKPLNDQSQVTIPKTTLKQSSSSSSVAPASETANWKTFTSQYGYSVRYPSDWFVHTASWKEGVLQFDLKSNEEAIINFVEPNQPNHGGSPYSINIALDKPEDNVNNLPLRQLQKAKLLLTDMSFVKAEDFDLQGIKALKIYLNSGDGGLTSVLIPYKGKVVTITSSTFTVQNAPAGSYKKQYDYNVLFNQVLSTFKFTN